MTFVVVLHAATRSAIEANEDAAMNAEGRRGFMGHLRKQLPCPTAGLVVLHLPTFEED
jgi:hypothetical protein